MSAALTRSRSRPWPRSDGLRDRLLGAADRFLPEQPAEDDQAALDAAHRMRMAVVLSWLGLVCTTSTGLLYAYLGSIWSGVAIGSISVPLLATPLLVRRRVSLLVIANVATAATWVVTFVVGARTGGFSSPAVAWSFFHPITTYVVCGRRVALWWSAMSILQIAVFFLWDRAGVDIAQDISARSSSLLRTAGFVGCILTQVALIATIEGVRVASQEALDRANRTIEHQRILDDMHDGVGSQLLGLSMQARAGTLDDERLLQALDSCLDDMRLIVDSLDPTERSFEVAIAELRARVDQRCHAAGVDLTWTLEPPVRPLEAAQTLQVLRCVQEMTTNALRHARSDRLEVSFAPLADDRSSATPTGYRVSVRDHGVGFDPAAPPRLGRGLTSLQTRARRLGGRLVIEPARPGTRCSIELTIDD